MDEDQERRLAEALESDLPLLWEYALEALVAALLRKAYPLPETQDRILQAHQRPVARHAGDCREPHQPQAEPQRCQRDHQKINVHQRAKWPAGQCRQRCQQ